MKKVYVLAIVSILFTACSSEAPSAYNSYDEKSKIAAEENHLEEFAFSLIMNKQEPWVPNDMRVAIIEKETYKELQIVARRNYGQGGEFELFTLAISGFKGNGIYKIAGKDYKTAWYMSANSQEYVNDNEASLEITNYNAEEGLISGSFSGSMYAPSENKITLPIDGVINQLKIQGEEDVISNSKKPLQ